MSVWRDLKSKIYTHSLSVWAEAWKAERRLTHGAALSFWTNALDWKKKKNSESFNTYCKSRKAFIRMFNMLKNKGTALHFCHFNKNIQRQTPARPLSTYKHLQLKENALLTLSLLIVVYSPNPSGLFHTLFCQSLKVVNHKVPSALNKKTNKHKQELCHPFNPQCRQTRKVPN